MSAVRNLPPVSLALGLSFLIVSGLGAQERVSLGVLGGIALPTGDFGDELSEDAGLATTGFVLGAEVVVPIRPAPGLGWASSLAGMTFGVDDDFAAGLADFFPGEATIDMGRYWSAVLFTGLRYTATVMPDVDLHGTGQVGAGMLKAPDASLVVLGTDYELDSSWEPVKGLAAGLGATFQDRLTLDARYFHFISPEISGELRYLSEVEDLSGEQPVSFVQITLGWRLR